MVVSPFCLSKRNWYNRTLRKICIEILRLCGNFLSYRLYWNQSNTKCVNIFIPPPAVVKFAPTCWVTNGLFPHLAFILPTKAEIGRDCYIQSHAGIVLFGRYCLIENVQSHADIVLFLPTLCHVPWYVLVNQRKGLFEFKYRFSFWFIGVGGRLESLPREGKLCQSDGPTKNHITQDHKSWSIMTYSTLSLSLSLEKLAKYCWIPKSAILLC